MQPEPDPYLGATLPMALLLLVAFTVAFGAAAFLVYKWQNRR